MDEEFGFEAVIFSDLNKTREELIENILVLCSDFYDINVNEDNFLKMFNIANNNLKILKSIRREVDKLRAIHQCYLIQKVNFNGQDVIGESYESFVRKRVLLKYQSQSEVIKVML